MTASPLGALDTLTTHLAASPVEAGIGLVPVEVRPGYVRARIPVSPSCLRSDGGVSGLVLSVAADCGVGVSVHSSVPGSAGGPTVELRLDVTGVVAPSARTLHVEGWALGVGPVSGTGRVEIRDEAGSLVAGAVGVMSIERTAPHVRDDEPVSPDVVACFDPATVAVHAESVDGVVAAALLSDGMRNSMGSVHGGVLAALADAAQECFRQHHGVTRPLSLTIEYLRPAHVAFGELSCFSTFLRRGRRFWSVRTELRRPDGVPVVQATGTSLVLPG